MAAMRVLLVDDSPQVVTALGALLRVDAGVELVGSAHDARSALAEVARRAPDLVVLDVDLAAGSRGYDVLCQIRQRHPQVAVVMLSNFGWQSMRAAFLSAGASAYFDKALEFGRAVSWIRARAAQAGGSEPAAMPCVIA